MRLFVALSIPDTIAQRLMLLQGGVPGARWQRREQLHLTLRFIGEVDGSDARAVEDALAGIDALAFDLRLHGVGQPQDAHKFMPHVTLARLRHSDLDKVREWLTEHALSTSSEFTVDAFCLYSSKLTSDGSVYRVEQEYPLRGFHGEIDD